MFQLTEGEKHKVVTNCYHLENLKFSPNLPYASTEHGTIMAANVLNNEKAVFVSVQVVRTFIKLRQLLATNKELMKKIEDLEKKYDGQFKIVFKAINELMAPPKSPSRNIGFIEKQ